MGPKAKTSAPSKKNVEKKKEKVIEDKTFGLKNKKGAKQQKFIQQVEKQVKSAGVPPRKTALDDPRAKKEEKEKEKQELALLFRPVQKVEKGADPKSVVCAFFKQGQCSKGAKCKFSHDLTIERKAEKRSLYVDMRDGEDENETMENWDEEKLNEVIERKHGEAEKKRPTTTIICKYFIDAVENSKYGWFWSCPNGPTCIYKHALPPGFVLKKDKKKEDKSNQISLEDLIERERAALAASSKFTKVTLESFLSWKKRKLKEKADMMSKAEEKKRSDYKAGRQVGLSGRDMFSFNPDLAKDDMEEGDEAFDSYKRGEDEDEDPESNYREIDIDLIMNDVADVDESNISQAKDRVFDPSATENGAKPKTSSSSSNNINNQSDETSTSDESPDKTTETSEDNQNNADHSPSEEGAAGVINENLFEEDVDLDELEEEMDELSI
uniref:Zinc finger CCCH domain-containing protein 15 n=1 Tax=Cacopsylla melanoneura TaxID=428564 RepID=A0A8D8ZR83_9HEMI